MNYEVYEAECYPDDDLTTYINQAIGYDKSGQNNDTFVMFNATDDYVDFTYYKGGGVKHYIRSSRGLSVGAIVGLVIVCLITLIIISLLILFFRRKEDKNRMNNDSIALALNTMN